jgi:S-adenosylmethionine hydrolase
VSYLWGEAAPPLRHAVRLDVPVDASPTFHGRDVFAPAAAELALGSRLEASGEPIDNPVVLAEAFAERVGTGLRGRVVVVDHFGNAITTIRAADIGAASIRSISWPGGATARLVSTYADIDQAPAALIGSAGHLEIAGRGQRVVDIGGPRLGDAVVVELA